MQDILQILGSNIRKLRKESGLTQEKLAEKANISTPFMTQVELGRKSASLEVVAKIADALGVDCGVLFLSDEVQNKNQKSIPYSLKVFEKVVLDDMKKLISTRVDELESNLR